MLQVRVTEHPTTIGRNPVGDGHIYAGSDEIMSRCHVLVTRQGEQIKIEKIAINPCTFVQVPGQVCIPIPVLAHVPTANQLGCLDPETGEELLTPVPLHVKMGQHVLDYISYQIRINMPEEYRLKPCQPILPGQSMTIGRSMPWDSMDPQISKTHATFTILQDNTEAFHTFLLVCQRYRYLNSDTRKHLSSFLFFQEHLLIQDHSTNGTYIWAGSEMTVPSGSVLMLGNTMVQVH